MKKSFLSLLALGLLTLSALADFYNIRSNVWGNWVKSGETITFASEGAKLDSGTLKIRIYGSDGQRILEIPMKAADFNQNGWSWQPEPGYYEIEFYHNGMPVVNSLPKGNTASRHNVVCLPSNDYTLTQVGANVNSPNMAHIARLLHIDNLRFTVAPNDLISNGQLNSKFDKMLSSVKPWNYEERQIMLAVRSDNKQSDDDKSPTDYSNAVLSVLDHHPYLKSVHLAPFKDIINTDEGVTEYRNYLRQTCISIINSENANEQVNQRTQVTIGPFNNENLYIFEQLVSWYPGQDFGCVGLSGLAQNNCKDTMTRITKKAHKNIEQWDLLNWPHLTDDYIYSIRDGNRRIIIDYLLAKQEGIDTVWVDNLQTGFFTNKPYLQPKYLSYLWITLHNHLGNNFKIIDSYKFETNNLDSQLAVLVEKEDKSQVLLFWNPYSNAIVINNSLVDAMTADSQCYDSENRIIPLQNHMNIQPEIFYLITKPNPEIIKTWEQYKYNALRLSDKVGDAIPKLQGKFHHRSLLFKDGMFTTLPESIFFNQLKSEQSDNQYLTGGDFAIGVTDTGDLDLIVRVDDATSTLDNSDENYVSGDEYSGKLEFAIDTGKGLNSHDVLKFTMTRNGNYGINISKDKAPYLSSYLAPNSTPLGNVSQTVGGRIERKDGKSIFYIRIPAAELVPFTAINRDKLLVSLCISISNPQTKSEEHLSWGAIEGNVDVPSFYGTLSSAEEHKFILMTMKDFNMNPQGDTPDYQITLKHDSDGEYLHVTPSATSAVLQTATIKNTVNKKVNVSFKIRGSAAVGIWDYSVVGNHKLLKTFDRLIADPDTWQEVNFTYSLPYKNFDTATGEMIIPEWGFFFKADNQPNYFFDIKDFTVTENTDII